MGVRIITDSAADLPDEMIKEYSIDVIPLVVYLENHEREYVEALQVYEGMRNGKVYKTMQVPIGEFKNRFSQYAGNRESCIYVAFSSSLSGTYQSAVMIRNEILEEYPEFDLDIIDTKGASLGFGLTVLKAAQMAREGRSKEEILKAIDFYSHHMEQIFTVDNLEYLYRGGRVSRTSAFIRGLLNIKPILDIEEGKLVPLEKVRGRKLALKRMVGIMEERGNELKDQIIGIAHGDDFEGAVRIKEMVQEKFGCENFIINMVGGVIGAHSGPGTLAVFFLNEKAPV